MLIMLKLVYQCLLAPFRFKRQFSLLSDFLGVDKYTRILYSIIHLKTSQQGTSLTILMKIRCFFQQYN